MKTPTLKKQTPAQSAEREINTAINKAAKEQAQIETDIMNSAIALHKEFTTRGVADNSNTFIKTLQLLNECRDDLLREYVKEMTGRDDISSVANVTLNRKANLTLLDGAVTNALNLYERRKSEVAAEKRNANRIG